MVAMPYSARTPGDQFLRFADEMWLWTSCTALAIAFVGIHAFALADKAFTASLWRLFALVSPAGNLPRYAWFVQQMSSMFAYAGAGVLASGLLFSYLRPGASPEALEALIRDNASSLLIVVLMLMGPRLMRDRNLAIVNRDIWGGPVRASLALLTKVAMLLLTLALLTGANSIVVR